MICSTEESQAIRAEAEAMSMRLMEMGCDSVAIFTTHMSKDGCTQGNAARKGNYYAQKGVVADWLNDVRDERLAKMITERGDDGERT